MLNSKGKGREKTGGRDLDSKCLVFCSTRAGEQETLARSTGRPPTAGKPGKRLNQGKKDYNPKGGAGRN